MQTKSVITVKPSAVLMLLLAVIGALLVGHLIVMSLEAIGGHDHIYGLHPLLHFDTEGNIPTLFSATLILFCAGLLILSGRISQRLPLFWYGLAAILVFLAIDEIHGFHEDLARVRGASRPDAILQIEWVIPYLMVVIMIGLMAIPFLRSLPKRFRILFILSGAVYTGGAAGVEVLTGFYEASSGKDLIYWALSTVEELLEMLGMALFAYSLIDYAAAARQGGTVIRIKR